MNATDKWMLDQMQQMAAGMAALPQISQTAEAGKTEKGESFQDLMNKAKDQKVDAPKKSDSPQKAEKPEVVQKQEPQKAEVVKNPDGTETKTVDLTPQEAAMVAAGYAVLSPVREDGTVWMVTVQDQDGNPVLPLAALEQNDRFSDLFVDEWTVEPTPELAEALEQLLEQTGDPRSAQDILAGLEQKLENPELGDKMQVNIQTPEVEQSDDEDMTDLAGELMADKPLFKDVKAAPVKVGENFQLDTQKPEMDDQLADAVRYAAQQGLRQIEIKLSPENLGNLTIKLTQAADGTLQVVLHAANAKAANLLNQHLDGLNTALQGYNQNSEVRVEVQRNEDGQQAQQQQTDPNGHNRQQQQQQRQEEHSHSQDFAQRLRLGLFGLEDSI
ncbi:MAG: hypothetical protein HFF58_01955 [Lawsonibacter sp.]|nr:hypothetical protein [Lawsonibacter sp.]